MENNRLINNPSPHDPPAVQLLESDSDLPAVCAGIIAGYKPNLPSTIWGQVRLLTVASAVALKPRTHSSARRAMTIIGLFSTWVVTVTGCVPTPERVFTQPHLDRFLGQHLRGHSTAYRFDVSRMIARAAAAMTGARLTQLPTPPQGAAVAPHTSDEQAQLYSWANTLSTPLKRQNARTLLALAGGAGLTAQQIMDTRVEDVDLNGSSGFVTVHGRKSRRVPVHRKWVRTLNHAIDGRANGPLFRGYRLEEYPPHELQRFLSENRGELRPSVARLRSGWIVGLLEANLPPSVLLEVTGFSKLGSLDAYLPYTMSHSTKDWLPAITGEVQE